MRKTFERIATEYGIIALVLYLAIFVIVLVGVYFALKAGWTPKSFAAQTGTWVLAYLITKATTPFRLMATIALSPIAARVFDRMRGRPPRGAAASAPATTDVPTDKAT
jgi:hypothetical protein